MMRPDRFISYAKEVLQVQVSEASVQDIERVDRSTQEPHEKEYVAIGRHLLDKLPDGRRGDYLNTVIEMARLAEGSPSVDDFVARFQDRFPSITLPEIARRRMRVLLALGLASVSNERVELTSTGRALVADQRLELLQQAMLERIRGTSEIAQMAGNRSLGELRDQLRSSPPAGLSVTQARLVLRWMEMLDLV